MWESRTKTDLIFEVWEKLDCESIGEAEIAAIETVIRAEYGESAVDSPMILARELADEGAELRHSEIMKLHVKRFLDSPYAPVFRNIFDISSFEKTLSSIRNLENLRRKFLSENDKDGLRLLKENTIKIKYQAVELSKDRNRPDSKRMEKAEIAEWFTLWLQSPEIFESWIKLRQNSTDFKTKFETSKPIERDVF